MSRYIDKDKVLQKYKNDFEYPYHPFIWGAVEAIERMPEADVVEIVLCKDCKYYIDNECYMSNLKRNGSNLGKIYYVKKDDYCSYGERKE